MLPASALPRSVVTLCIPGFPSQDAKPKEGREEERRGEVTNGFSLRFSGRRASGRGVSPPILPLASQESQEFSRHRQSRALTTRATEEEEEEHSGFFCSFRGHSVRRNASREGHMATLSFLSLSLLVGCCSAALRWSKVMFFALFAFRAFSPSSSCLAAFSQHNRPRPSAIPGIFPRMSGISSLTILAIFERLSLQQRPKRHIRR